MSGLQQLAIGGIGKQTVFATAVAATQHIAVVSENIQAASTPMVSAHRTGARGAEILGLGNIEVSGQIVEQMRFFDAVGSPGDSAVLPLLLMENFFGTHAANVYTLKDSTEGLFLTFAIDKQTVVHEWKGLKVTELVLSSTPADGLRATYTVVGNDQSWTPATSAAAVAALKDAQPFVLHKDLTKAWVADQTDALASGDHWSIDSLEIRATRPMDSVFVNAQRQVLEPVENDQPVVTIVINIPRYAAETWRTWQQNGTSLQAEFQWSLNSEFVTVLVPNCRIDGAVEVVTGSAAPYSQAVTLRAFRNDGVNTFITTAAEMELNLLT